MSINTEAEKHVVVEIISRERVFDRHRKVDKVVCQLSDGTTEDFYIYVGSAGAAVLALTPDNKILLAQQYRLGPAAFLSELPGGSVDASELPIDAARRELLEETGYAGELEQVGSMWVDAWSSIERHYFIARNCAKVAGQKLDDQERVEVAAVSIDEFRDLWRAGRMTDIGGAYMCLDYLGLL